MFTLIFELAVMIKEILRTKISFVTGLLLFVLQIILGTELMAQSSVNSKSLESEGTTPAAADSIPKMDRFTVRGYVKDMQIVGFRNLDMMTTDNLLHNRLNFRLYPDSHITVGMEVRNRVFFGESINLNTAFATFQDQDDGLVDMSWRLIDKRSLLMLTQIDRAWLHGNYGKWEARVGRQRINWGVNLFWNANDLFNVYSLTDFDYEERPGTDAVRVQKYFANYSSMDVAVQPGRDENSWIGAAMYKFNKWQYDFQVLGGWWNEDVATGAGWAGNFKGAGFKGEATYFHPQDNWQDTTGVLSVSVSGDYVFGNGIFATTVFLFNSSGINKELGRADNLFSQPISAKNLFPTKYSFLLSLSKPFSPIISGSLVALYSPYVNSVLMMPSVNWVIANNWEFAFFAQTYFLEVEEFANIGNSVFLRFKYSF
ncbi:MAG: hypothetical protein WD077_02060 [Bacteroidia bacterium]